jgi:tetratricopeptide (TPR) repeat protein
VDFLEKLAGKLVKKFFFDLIFSKKVLNYGARPMAAQGLTDLQYAQQFVSRGDYAGALKVIDGAKEKKKPTADYLCLRGTVLKHLGDLAGAEADLRQTLTMESNPEKLAVYQSELGQILSIQERLPEAVQCFQTSTQLAPTRAAGMRDMAEACLRMGYMDYAFEWAKRAVDADHHAIHHNPVVAQQEALQMNLSTDLATLAWVVAAHSQDAESVGAIADEALQLAGYKHITTVSQVNYHLGLAYATLGDKARGSDHWNRAARSDAQGHWGRSAQTLLKSLA